MQRLAKELDELHKGAELSGVNANPVGENMKHLKGTLKGPESTPYEGGIFVVDIKLPNEYPFEPPKMTFETKIWHPNVSSQTGAICLDILKDQWSPALNLKTALLSLQALMCTPEPNDPQDAEVAKQYINNRDQFNKHAKFWTETYAQPKPEGDKESKISTLVEMGFSAEMAKSALEKCGWDQDQALNSLLG